MNHDEWNLDSNNNNKPQDDWVLDNTAPNNIAEEDDSWQRGPITQQQQVEQPVFDELSEYTVPIKKAKTGHSLIFLGVFVAIGVVGLIIIVKCLNIITQNVSGNVQPIAIDKPVINKEEPTGQSIVTDEDINKWNRWIGQVKLNYANGDLWTLKNVEVDTDNRMATILVGMSSATIAPNYSGIKDALSLGGISARQDWEEVVKKMRDKVSKPLFKLMTDYKILNAHLEILVKDELGNKLLEFEDDGRIKYDISSTITMVEQPKPNTNTSAVNEIDNPTSSLGHMTEEKQTGNTINKQYDVLLYKDDVVILKFNGVGYSNELGKQELLFTAENISSNEITLYSDSVTINSETPEQTSMSINLLPSKTSMVRLSLGENMFDSSTILEKITGQFHYTVKLTDREHKTISFNFANVEIK